MAAEIHVGDTITFQATIKDESGSIVDVSTASTMEMIFNKPDGTPAVKTASHVTDGTDGKIKYDSITTDLDVAGDWVAQGFVIIGPSQFNSDIHSFRVHPNLKRS